MNSRRMKKMASDVVKVSRKQVFRRAHTECTAPEKHSLISSDQPLSDSDNNNDNSSIVNIPKGFMAVYVGPHDRRFVIPTRFLSVPDFKEVMDMAAEEFGYEQQGGLRIPCDEDDFQKLLAACKFKFKSKSKSNSNSNSSHLHAAHHYSHLLPISN